MFSLKVLEITKVYSQADNSDILEVRFSVLDEQGNQVEELKHGFPLTHTQDDIKAELAKFLDTYHKDQELKAKNAEYDRLQAKADETISSLTGFEISGKIEENTQ